MTKYHSNRTDCYFWLGASAEPTISRATAERFWQACLKHEKTIRIDALFDMLAALGLRLTVVKADKA